MLTHAYFEQSPEEAASLLERERQATGVNAQLITFCTDTPGYGLHLQAERENADLIVVGSCTRGALGRATLGDDTRAALNGAPVCGRRRPPGLRSARPPGSSGWRRLQRDLAGEELAAFGDEVDLLVLGSRGYGPIRRMMVGSTCDYLERHGRCPLLVLPRMGVDTEVADAEQAAAAQA